MTKNLTNFFNKNTDNLPKIIAVSTFFTDLLCLYYINNYWLKIKLSSLINSIRGTMSISGLDYQSMAETKAVLANSLGTMFFFFILWHAVIYILMFFKKKWAINYVKRYVLCTVILTVFELIALFTDSLLWFSFVLFLTGLYLFTYLGLKHFIKSQEQ